MVRVAERRGGGRRPPRGAPTSRSSRRTSRHPSASFIPARDITIAELDGRVVGVGVARGRRHDRRASASTASTARSTLPVAGAASARALLAENERRQRELAADRRAARGRAIFGSWSSERQPGDVALLESAGFEPRALVLRDGPAEPRRRAGRLAAGRPRAPPDRRARSRAPSGTPTSRRSRTTGAASTARRSTSSAGSTTRRHDLSHLGRRVRRRRGRRRRPQRRSTPEQNAALGVQRGWLESVFTRRPWRRRGLATALIARSLVRAPRARDDVGGPRRRRRQPERRARPVRGPRLRGRQPVDGLAEGVLVTDDRRLGCGALGWDERFATLLASEAPGLVPGRVLAEERGQYLVASARGRGPGERVRPAAPRRPRSTRRPSGRRSATGLRSSRPCQRRRAPADPARPAPPDARSSARAPGDRRMTTQVLAANVDVVFVVTSVNAEFNVRRLERYLSVAWESGATPVVLLSKSDLADDIEALPPPGRGGGAGRRDHRRLGR